jgi:hypothetical protein
MRAVRNSSVLNMFYIVLFQEKSQQNQIQKQQEEEKAIEAKKQAARLQVKLDL